MQDLISSNQNMSNETFEKNIRYQWAEVYNIYIMKSHTDIEIRDNYAYYVMSDECGKKTDIIEGASTIGVYR